MRQLSATNLIGIVLAFTLLTSCTIENKNYITLDLLNHQVITSTQHLTELNNVIYNTFVDRVRDSIPHATAWNRQALKLKKASPHFIFNAGTTWLYVPRLEKVVFKNTNSNILHVHTG